MLGSLCSLLISFFFFFLLRQILLLCSLLVFQFTLGKVNKLAHIVKSNLSAMDQNLLLIMGIGTFRFFSVLKCLSCPVVLKDSSQLRFFGK